MLLVSSGNPQWLFYCCFCTDWIVAKPFPTVTETLQLRKRQVCGSDHLWLKLLLSTLQFKSPEKRPFGNPQHGFRKYPVFYHCLLLAFVEVCWRLGFFPRSKIIHILKNHKHHEITSLPPCQSWWFIFDLLPFYIIQIDLLIKKRRPPIILAPPFVDTTACLPCAQPYHRPSGDFNDNNPRRS